MDKLNVGIIGCGYICSLHIKNIIKCQKMHLVGVADIKRDAAEKIKQESGAEYATDDIDNLIQDKNIDALLIFSSHNTHPELIKKLCEEKKPFFVEKPLALSSDDCMKIQTWVKEADVKNQVGYWVRHSPLVARVAKIIPSPYFILARCLKGGGDNFDPRIVIEKADIMAKSAYFDQAGYLFDFVLRLIPSEPVSIQSMTISDKINNNINSNVKFKNGAMAAIINGDIGSGGYLKKWFFEVIGGSISASIDNHRQLVFNPDNGEGVDDNDYFNGFNEQMDMFASYVLEGGKSPMDVREATLPTVLMEKAVESAKSGDSISVNINEFLIN